MALATLDDVEAVAGGPVCCDRGTQILDLVTRVVAERLGWATEPPHVPAVVTLVVARALASRADGPGPTRAEQIGSTRGVLSVESVYEERFTAVVWPKALHQGERVSCAARTAPGTVVIGNAFSVARQTWVRAVSSS